jgi:SAM-dependent methyltransferase
VYVNDPINYVYAPGSVRVLNINERIAELPFTFGEVAKVPPPARVLDVGSSESPVTLGLATLGYQVTAVDPRGYAFPHPNLSVAAVEAQDLDDHDPFDLVVMLSTIEHVGIGHYVDAHDDTADFRVMERVAQLVRPGARLVLTTPFGNAAQDEVQRIYDPVRLTKLLDGWTPDVVRILERASSTQWDVVADRIELLQGDAFRVAMVSAVFGG